jgi:hypothetical protein
MIIKPNYENFKPPESNLTEDEDMARNPLFATAMAAYRIEIVSYDLANDLVYDDFASCLSHYDKYKHLALMLTNKHIQDGEASIRLFYSEYEPERDLTSIEYSQNVNAVVLQTTVGDVITRANEIYDDAERTKIWHRSDAEKITKLTNILTINSGIPQGYLRIVTHISDSLRKIIDYSEF